MKTLIGALAVGLAALASGCGGNDTEEKNAYVQQVNRAQTSFAQTVEELSGQITATSSTDADRKTLNRFEDAIDEVVANLNAIDPPEGLRPEHATLVKTIDGFGGEVGEAVNALDTEDPQKLLRAQRELKTATAEVSADINRTIASINAKLQE